MKDDKFKITEYEIKELLYNDLFQEDVATIRIKQGIPLLGFPNDSTRRKWLAKKSENERKEYHEDIQLLMSNYSLGFKWRDGLFLFIELANKELLRVQHNWSLTFNHTGESSRPTDLRDIVIEVDPSITQKELLEAHEAVKKLVAKAGMKTKPQYIENLDRDYEVYNMKKRGKSVKEICSWLNENKPGAFNDDNVKKIVTRAKNRFGKRHPWPK